MGQLLVDEELVPELIISSTAARARQTAELVAESCGYEGEVRYNRSLYMADPEQYVAVAEKTKPQIDRLMLIGHNPGMTYLKAMLTGDDEHMPTASLAVITFDIDDWRALSIHSAGKLEALWLPRELD